MSPELVVLGILQLRGVGRRLGTKIVEACPDMLTGDIELYEALHAARGCVPEIRAFDRVEVESATSQAMEVLEAAQRQDIQIIVRGTDRMPRQLATAPDPPLLLFARGNLACLSGNAPVAVVGTRTPSDFGRRVAERFGQRLAGHHHTVVSGLAIGCDTAAHQGCLAAGGKTVAVLAHGLDMTYPAVNKSLAAVIVDRGGCLLSEYLPGTRPRSSYFVERDRIQSGLSFGVLVVETTQDGGTMHTARYCMAQGRALGCLVHPETERENGVLDGNLVLLEQHTAIPIRDEGDLVAFLSKTRSRQANVG